MGMVLGVGYKSFARSSMMCKIPTCLMDGHNELLTIYPHYTFIPTISQ
jgi:hypothetical protein